MATQGKVVSVGCSPTYFSDSHPLDKASFVSAAGDAAKDAILSMTYINETRPIRLEGIIMKFELKRTTWDWKIEATVFEGNGA